MTLLGTMAGNQLMLKGNNDELTYARKYEPFGGSDDLRTKIAMSGNDTWGEGYKKIGEEYSYVPFPGKSSSMQGGGFFRTVKTLENEDRFLNCFGYALGTFETPLEALSGKSIKEIQTSVLTHIDHIVAQYFTNVSEPEEGNLAIYSVSPGATAHTALGAIVSGTTHAGVYRKSQPNWNSPQGGTIESKWGYFANPYVFQHDVFFTPPYGDVVKFYELKKHS